VFPISFKWGEQATNLFSGSAAVREVTDTSIVLDLLRPQFSQNVLELGQDLSRIITASFRKSGTVVEATILNHGLSTSNQAIFEDLTTVTGLNYDFTTNPEPYSITVVDGNTVTLDDTVADDFGLTTSATADTGFISIPVVRPRAFGKITHRLPVQKVANILSNPHFKTTEIIRIYEDGVQIGAKKSTSTSINITAVTAATTTTYTVVSHEYIVGDVLLPTGFGDSQYHVAQTIISIGVTSFVTSFDSTGFSTASPGSVDFS
jgi:hypothetical protein